MNALTSFFTTGKGIDDRLSPILVKELRQGMRARVFVVSFLLLQVFLVVLVLANVAAQEDRSTLASQNAFFWIIIGFALLALMPLRGLGAISLEVKNRTMETILLTRLSAWRVVFGKWSALFAQSLLFVSALLPYVVLRYFIGGDDIVSDFAWILFMLWLSGILIAGSIAVSAMGNAVVRVLLVIGIISILGGGFGDLSFRGMSAGPGDFWEALGWMIIFGFFVPALLFEITASSLAPASENHALLRRLLAVAFFLSACGLSAMSHSGFESGVMVPLIILVGICYFELSEKPRLVPRMVQSLARFGSAGRLMALFLLPGWPSAVLFSLLVIPGAIGLSYGFIPPSATDGWLLPIFATLGSVLVPIFFCHVLWPKMKQVLLAVFIYNAVLWAVAGLLEGSAALTKIPVDPLLAFLPSLPVLSVTGNVNSMRDYASWYYLGNGSVLGLVILLLLLGSRSFFREVFAVFRAARANRPATEPPAPPPGTP